MRHVAVPLVALLLAPVVLAGCLGGAPEDVAPAADADAPVVVTRPDDYSSLMNDSDVPAGERWHVHNYWGGEDRLLVMDSEGSTGFSCTGCDEEFAFTFRRPEPKHVVPQGASHVVVTVSWVEEPGGAHGPLTLWVRSADMKEMAKIGTVENGATVTINSTNEKNDPPHQVLSLWQFGLGLTDPEGDGEVSFSGTVRFVVEAVRGLEIPPWPPHPDLWQGRTGIPLFDESNSIGLIRQQDGNTDCTDGCLRTHRPEDGVVVPYDATEVIVTLTFGPGLPAGFGIEAHGADTWARAPLEGESPSPGVIEYRVPVSPANGDSPYAKQSLWEFRGYLDQATPMKAWSGSYRLEAKAVKA